MWKSQAADVWHAELKIHLHKARISPTVHRCGGSWMHHTINGGKQKESSVKTWEGRAIKQQLKPRLGRNWAAVSWILISISLYCWEIEVINTDKGCRSNVPKHVVQGAPAPLLMLPCAVWLDLCGGKVWWVIWESPECLGAHQLRKSHLSHPHLSLCTCKEVSSKWRMFQDALQEQER